MSAGREPLAVQRMAVVDHSGVVRIRLHNGDNCPPGIFNGVPIEYERPKQAGFMFYTQEATECGGLMADGPFMTFDQFRQDQTVMLQVEQGIHGVVTFERSEVPLIQMARRVQKVTTSRGLARMFRRAMFVAWYLPRALTGRIGRNRARLTVRRGTATFDLFGRPSLRGQSEVRLAVDGAGNVECHLP